MPLEATFIVIDNSEWMRNCDYSPSRLKAQSDAVNMVFNAKTQSNPESACGIIAHGGKGPELLCALTNEMGNVLIALHNIKIAGQPHFSSALQVAALGLKHRQNKNQSQRIVIFVGSPIHDDEQDLVRLAKKLKKNNVAVDVVAFGEDNQTLLQSFVEAVNNGENSNFVHVPVGPGLLSDALLTTPIIAGEGVQFQGGSGGYEFGVDPTLDPELALALRISMEEERARQEGSTGGEMAVDSQPQQPQSEEDRMLAEALALSMQQDVDMEVETQQPSTAQNDQALLNAVNSLPGVDPNDPRIKEALNKKKDEKK